MLYRPDSDNLYPPTFSLALYQNGIYYNGINIFNKLSPKLKEFVHMPKLFKDSLRRYLAFHCFYKLEEFYSVIGKYGFSFAS
jgi:hypothetical protein